MDKKAIETLAVNAVKNSVVVCDLLDQFISDNDKEPSWDGHIYIYKDARKTKDGVRRIPVQIKGKESGDLSKTEISFPVFFDLTNYLNDGGIVFFVVCVSCDGRSAQVYYVSLTPVKLRVLLHDAAFHKSKNIRLKKFPENNYEKTMIIINCWNDCQRQASFSNAKLYTLEELTQQGTLESVSFSVTSVGNWDPRMALLTNEVYLYANIKGGVIPQPIEAIPQRLIIQEEKDASVIVGDRLFYTRVKVIREKNAIQTIFGSSFSITARTNNQEIKYSYRGVTKVRELAIDLDFMLSFIDVGTFIYDGVAFPFLQEKQIFQTSLWTI